MSTCWDRALRTISDIQKSDLDKFGLEIEKPQKQEETTEVVETPEPQTQTGPERPPFDRTYEGVEADWADEPSRHLMFFNESKLPTTTGWYHSFKDGDRTISYITEFFKERIPERDWPILHQIITSDDPNLKFEDCATEEIYLAFSELFGFTPDERVLKKIRRKRWRPDGHYPNPDFW